MSAAFAEPRSKKPAKLWTVSLGVNEDWTAAHGRALAGARWSVVFLNEDLVALKLSNGCDDLKAGGQRCVVQVVVLDASSGKVRKTFRWYFRDPLARIPFATGASGTFLVAEGNELRRYLKDFEPAGSWPIPLPDDRRGAPVAELHLSAFRGENKVLFEIRFAEGGGLPVACTLDSITVHTERCFEQNEVGRLLATKQLASDPWIEADRLLLAGTVPASELIAQGSLMQKGLRPTASLGEKLFLVRRTSPTPRPALGSSVATLDGQILMDIPGGEVVSVAKTPDLSRIAILDWYETWKQDCKMAVTYDRKPVDCRPTQDHENHLINVRIIDLPSRSLLLSFNVGSARSLTNSFFFPHVRMGLGRYDLSLSPSGSRLAVLFSGKVMLYRLPPSP